MNMLVKVGGGVLGAALAALIGDKVYSAHHYDEDGFNANGFDRGGYDREGFNREGYDREGYDREGYDQKGFNREGFDREGYDRRGFDSRGFNRRGFDCDGFDINGYDSDGFDRKGYNNLGLDRSDRDSSYYRSSIREMRELAQKAHRQMKQGEFAYAFRDIRVDSEKALKAILGHRGKVVEKGESLNSMIYRCRRYKLIPADLSEKLDGLRFQCNDAQHDTEVEKNYNDAHFCYKTLCETIDYLESTTQD